MQSQFNADFWPGGSRRNCEPRGDHSAMQSRAIAASQGREIVIFPSARNARGSHVPCNDGTTPLVMTVRKRPGMR